MWSVIAEIFSLLGIILLVLLGILVIILFIILFFPITYKGKGHRNQEETVFRFRAIWIFGLIRAGYQYPDPGIFKVQLLWFTIFPKKDKGKKSAADNDTESVQTNQINSEQVMNDEKNSSESVRENSIQQNDKNKNHISESKEEHIEEDAFWEGHKSFVKKIKYTIEAVYDKIKSIFENISFYMNLLQEQSTVELWEHVKLRLVKILRSIRPRHLKADIIFGTGEPDTTGYAYGAYSIFAPQLGKKVYVTPDFTEKKLEGTIEFSGHLTIFILLWHCLMVALDRNLHTFIETIKSRRK